MQKRFPKYTKSFWIVTFFIIIISVVIFIVNNYSPAAYRQVLNETIQNSTKVSNDLNGIQTEVNQYVKMISDFIQVDEILKDQEKLDLFLSESKAVLNRFVASEKCSDGFFLRFNPIKPEAKYELLYDKKKDETSHISKLMDYSYINSLEKELKERKESFWITIYNAFSNQLSFAYIVPLYHANQYIGFIGITIDMEYLSEVVLQREAISSDNRKIFLLTEDKEVLVQDTAIQDAPLPSYNTSSHEGYLKVNFEDKKQILAYYTLPSEQIFVEIIYRPDEMAEVNWFLVLITIILILSIWVVQKDTNTKRSALDAVVDTLINVKKTETEVVSYNQKKAISVLIIGTSGVFLSYGLYFLFIGKNFYLSIAYFGMILFVITSIRFYIRWLHINLISNLTVYGLSLFPIVLHISKGGFVSVNTGTALSWVLIVVLLSVFALGEKKAKNAIGLFNVMLIISLLIEIYVLKNNEYERLFTFVTSLHFIGSAIFIATNIYLKGSNEDYAKIQKIYNDVRESQARLVQKEKMAALGQLIAGVAHEINTPMGAIKASAQTMESKLSSVSKLMYRCGQEFDDVDYDCFFTLIRMSTSGVKQMKSTIEIRKARKEIDQFFKEIGLMHREEILEKIIRFEITDLNLIQDNIEVFANKDICEILDIVAIVSSYTVGIQAILFATTRVSRIIFALKSYAHSDLENKEVKFDIVKNIENILILYHNQLKRSIDLERDYDESIPDIYGKQDELSQVWANLVQNAIQAMPNGGTLKISIKTIDKKWVCVKIADTGMGIPEDLKERIFEPFFTTKPLGEGSGMGLDISRKVVLDHKGSIRVTSEKGKGTIFSVQIPMMEGYIDEIESIE